LVITTIGSLAVVQERVPEPRNDWHIEAPFPALDYWTSVLVTLERGSHIDVEIQVSTSLYTTEIRSYQFEVRSVANMTVIGANATALAWSGDVTVAEILPGGAGWIGSPVHHHFDVPRDGAYELLFGMDIPYSLEPEPRILSTPLLVDWAGPILLLVSGVGTLLASVVVWMPRKNLHSPT